MSHTDDVIKMYINDGNQKLKIHGQLKMSVLNCILNIFPLIYDKKQGRGDINFHRRLWEGQEIDRRSKIKIHDHFGGYD